MSSGVVAAIQGVVIGIMFMLIAPEIKTWQRIVGMILFITVLELQAWKVSLR